MERSNDHTHDHFDHTANNAYFDRAYMTAATQPLATLPFPSFEGIDFPRDYPVEIVKDGDKLDLGGRTLEVLEIPDHAAGSIALLDSRERILFSGDEITGSFKMVNGSIKTVLEQLKKVQARKEEYDVIWPGSGMACTPDLVDRYVTTLEYLLDGGEGEPGMGLDKVDLEHEQPSDEPIEGKTVYDRFQARPCDLKIDPGTSNPDIYHVDRFGALVIYKRDNT